MDEGSLGECRAILVKVATTADGGTRITLDLTAQDALLAAKLLQMKLMAEELLNVRFTRNSDL